MLRPSIEFRIPISPTERFFALVRFFNFALRRLDGEHYRNARLTVVVGDYCDLDEVRRRNRWSEDFNIVWERVPDEIFAELSWAGTASWRFLVPAGDADVIILSDADTVLLRDIDPLIDAFPLDAPAVRGHMAHFPPSLKAGSAAPPSRSPEFWPWLFKRFGLAWPDATNRYSIDPDGSLPLAPPYFNLGFVALNAKACSLFRPQVLEVTRDVAEATGSFMKCQIALTLMAYRSNVEIGVLPAAYNAANDLHHLAGQSLAVEDIRVLHFLRTDEIDRAEFEPHLLDGLIAKPAVNPANAALQALAREYRASLGSAPHQ